LNEELYALLEVAKEATTAEIRAAYWTKAKTAHPDAGGDPDEFVALTAAYTTLSDKKLRADYDLAGQRPDEAIGQQLHRISVHISSMFEEIMFQAEVPPEQIDFITIMKGHILALQSKYQGDEAKLAKILGGFHKMHRLIRRKGAGHNVFTDIAEKKIIEVTEEYKKVQQQLGDCRRVYDVLANYETVVDVIRTVHAQQGFQSYASTAPFTFFPPVKSGGN
jgi:curved DNA-binding protein CbpA